MVADMEVDNVAYKVADMVAYKVANMVADKKVDININVEIQIGRRVGHGGRGLVNWAQKFSTRSFPGLRIF